MSTLTITKKSNLVWLHEPSDKLKYILGKFTFSIDGDYFQIIETGQSKRNKYRYSDITIVDEINSQTFSSFANIVELSEKLAELNYLGFDIAFTSGVVSVNGNTGIVVLNGTNINVTNPVTSSSTSLNQALSDILSSGGGGSQDLDQTLANGSTAVDKSITLDSTPDDIYDIFKSELIPGVFRSVYKENGSILTYTFEASSGGIAWFEGDGQSSIRPTLTTEGNVISGDLLIPPTSSPETIATVEYIASQNFEAKSNKATTMTGNTTSNTKYLSAKAVYDWVIGLGYTTLTAVQTWVNAQGFITNVITALGFTPANKSGETFTGAISAPNLSGTNTGDNAVNSNYASDYRASNFIADVNYLTPDTANNLFDFKPVVYNKTTNLPIIGTATLNNVEGLSILASGAVSRSFADTNLFNRTQRLGLIATVTGTLAQIRQTSLYFSGNTGYEVIFKFGFAENATDTAIRAFIGLSTNVVFTNVEPDTLLNCIAVGRLSTSNNLHLIYNDNTGTATIIDLGSNFPANTINTDVYLVKFVTVAGSNSVSVYVERQNTGNTYTTTLTTDIPALSQGLNFGGYIVDTAGANVTTGFDFMGMYVKN